MGVTDATEPVMAFCRILDDADCDLHFYRTSSGKPAHIDTPDGHTIILPRFGARFYLPYENRSPGNGTTEFVAAGNDGDESPSPMHYSPTEPGSDAGAGTSEPDALENADVECGREHAPPQPAGLPMPDAPSDEQHSRHNLTHADFASWCPHCVAGKAADSQHKRKNKHEDPQIPVLQVDDLFFGRDGQLVEEESKKATVLTGTDLSSGWPMMAFVPHNGVEAYTVRALTSWVRRLGYPKGQHNQESALRTVVDQVQKELGHDHVQVRAALRYSHASQGGTENANRLMAGMLRTWLSALNETYPNPAEPLDINHPVIPWLCRWVAFVWARFHVQADNMTPFRIVSGRDYATPIVEFGEVVLCKLPDTKSLSKAKPRWFKGLFVGRLEVDDSAVVLTDAGAITVRSVRRLLLADQHDVAYLNAGLPWAPAGKRTKVRTESSQIVALPAPPVSEASQPPLSVEPPAVSKDAMPVPPDVVVPDPNESHRRRRFNWKRQVQLPLSGELVLHPSHVFKQALLASMLFHCLHLLCWKSALLRKAARLQHPARHTQWDPREVEEARDVQMATLVEKQFATPKLKPAIPHKCKLFNFKWVDEITRGAYRSRFTCADIKKRYSKEELAEEINTFAPTPYEESHVLLELKCLQNGWHSRSGDVRCAYLLGTDPGDSNGNPPEYVQHFHAWLAAHDACGLVQTRRPAARWQFVRQKACGRQLSSRVRESRRADKLVSHGYHFVRGKRDPTVYTCSTTDATLLHHVDDVRMGASDADLNFLQSKNGLGNTLT